MTAARHTSQGSLPRKPRTSVPPRGSSPPAPARVRRMRSAGRSLVTRQTGFAVARGRGRGGPAAHWIYLPPPGRHLLVGRDHVHVRRGPRENQARPAIDPLFRSAAVNGSRRVIGVVLSGRLNDGTSGLHAIKRCGGIAVVRSRVTRRFPTCRATPWPTRAVTERAYWHLPAAAMRPTCSRGSSSCLSRHR